MTHSSARRNPYIIGRPINEDEPELFFGRESLFHCIEESLKQRKQVILLHGQRRIGKSSVLRQIPRWLASEPFVFVPFDLECHSREPLSQVLDALARDILERLESLQHSVAQIAPRFPRELETNPQSFSREFLPQVNQALGDKTLVLLLDEFDTLSQDSCDSTVKLFDYLKDALPHQKNLSLIAFVGRHPGELAQLRALFPQAVVREIGFLDEIAARELITKSAQGILNYEPEAIQGILELAAGHPYFTQVICFTLFAQARVEKQWQVTRADVESIVERAIESAGGGLAWFWDGLLPSEKVVLAAVAEAQKIALSKNWSAPEDPLVLLEKHGVIRTESLVEAAKQLIEKGLLDETGRTIKVELVRRWLVQRHPLQQEIRELENLKQNEVNPLLKEAANLRQKGEIEKALKRDKQVLALNPNHVKVLLTLAEGYLDANDFEKAVELYNRAFQIDPIRNKDGLVHSLMGYGDKLLEQQEFEQAKQQFERVLKLEPDNTSVQEILQQLEQLVQYQELSQSEYSQRNRFKRQPIEPIELSIRLSLAVMVVSIILLGLGVYRWKNPCPPGQHKVFGVFCQADRNTNISRGERTLFPFENDINRDRGVKAFKEGKFVKAARFFERAKTADSTDPEVLIYYNNALARQRSSRYTLAVVVPVDNVAELAKRILRGVAQAQNQFNSPRIERKPNAPSLPLLEIIIANDGNKPDRAKQVARELIKNPSVLGAIGHSSSDATEAALPEYEKAGLALISPTSTSDWLTGDVFFRTVPSDNKASRKLADYIKYSLGFNRVVIFNNPQSVYSTSLTQEFTKIFQQLGGRVVREIDLSNPNFNAEGEVETSVSQDKAQAALLFQNGPYNAKAHEIAKANAQLIANPNNKQKQGLKLLGGDTLYYPETLKAGRPDNKKQPPASLPLFEGLVLAVPWFEKAPRFQPFLNIAKQEWGGQVEITGSTARSFDAAQALIAALSPDASRATVLQRLRQINLPPSQTSGEPLQFTKQGERNIEPILVQVVGGQFQRVELQNGQFQPVEPQKR